MIHAIMQFFRWLFSREANNFAMPVVADPAPVGFKRDGTRTENTLTMRSIFQREKEEAMRVRGIIEPLREFYSRRPRPWRPAGYRRTRHA